ncbi:MAG: hypothetical protein FWE67_01975 [Planctomycetaceae bacterium]|nr:hypothetical protein [Planctomycetaceae bacterium]
MWNGNGTSTSIRPFTHNDDFRQGIGLTDEQHEQLTFMYSKNGGMGHWYRLKAQTNPELAALLEEDKQLISPLRGNDPYGEKLTEEHKQAIIVHTEKSSTIYHAETRKDIENLLTPEQMQAVKEYELAMMGEIPILNPSMFECLDLTDDQKKQMADIKKEMEPMFGQIVEELVKAEDDMQEFKYDLFEAVGIKFGKDGRPVDENGKSFENNPELMKQKTELMGKKFAENVDVRTRMEQLSKRASGFMGIFKFKMLDVLTDEQLAKMQRIIDNPAEYVKKIRDKMQKERAEREKQESNKWQPGIDSWRPGDPLPEEYLKQRQQRKSFPKSDTAETSGK